MRVIISILCVAAVMGAVACGPSDDNNRRDATPSAECEPYQFDCGDGQQCIDSGEVCDGVEDCNTGNDEQDCGCGVGWTTCDNGDCVHAAFVCDGVFNCSDRSDENNCP